MNKSEAIERFTNACVKANNRCLSDFKYNRDVLDVCDESGLIRIDKSHKRFTMAVFISVGYKEKLLKGHPSVILESVYLYILSETEFKELETAYLGKTKVKYPLLKKIGALFCKKNVE